MPEQPKQRVRTNRVFKSLHKPLTYLGVERTLFYFVAWAQSAHSTSSTAF